MTAVEAVRVRARPSLELAIVVTAIGAILMAVLRFVLYGHQYVPIGYGLLLTLGLWHRHRVLHRSTAVVFLGMIVAKGIQMYTRGGERGSEAVSFAALQIANLVLMAVIIEMVNLYRDRSAARGERLASSNASLARSNAELAEANEELSAREEEIRRQNEELQAQTEEITRQNTELQAQAEEMESQAEQLRIRSEQMVAANADLARREEILQVLLRCARTLPSPQQAIEEICRVAGKMLGGPDGAAGVTMRSGDKIFVHTWSGSHPIAQRSWDYDRSFASIVLERGRTAALFDLALRPDIELPTPDGAAPIRAILATPYRIQGRAAGVFEVYRRTPHQFTEEDFRAIEWLSAQCALILEMLQLHEEIAERRKAAEEGSRRKTHFLAAVSHDIRTPANAITLISELIRRLSESNPASPEIQQLAADLQNASRSMVELVSDVLDLTRFDSGSQELNVSDFSLRAVLDAEIRQFLPTARQKGLALSLAFEAETEGLRLRTDRLKLARVVTNLIGNALKFTDAGSVQVTVARDRDGDGGVRIDVADTGIGIPAREIDAIFDEFLQLRNPERDRSKGTGLGLAICKRLVEAIGARMSVESEPGKGSCFRLHLPEATVAGSQERLPEQEQDAETDSLGTASSSDDRCLAGARILLVEDHDTTRRSTALLLEQYGAKVLAAAGGNEAIQALMHRDPDVLLLDLMLPDMDGAEVLRRLPAIRALRLACVLVVTGDARPEREAEVHALGADGLVHKPIDVRSLVGKIHSLLEKAHRAGSRPGGRALAP